MTKNVFHCILMLTYCETKVAKENFYGAKEAIKILDVDVDKIVISKLIETKNISKCLIRYLDEVT